MTTPSPLPLPAILDTAAAGPLRLALRKTVADGMPLSLDGGGVERVGLACLQVLAAARVAAGAADVAFQIDRPSAALTDMVTLAGLGELVAA